MRAVLDKKGIERLAILQCMKNVVGNIFKRFFSPWGFLQKHSHKSWFTTFEDSILMVFLALFGAGAALLLTEPWNVPAEPVRTITVSGLTLKTGDPHPEKLVRLAREHIQREVVLTGPDLAHTTSWAALGARVDMDSLERILVQMAQKDSPAVRYFREESDGLEGPTLGLPVSLVSGAAVESLVLLKDIFDRTPVNARFNFAKGKVIVEEDGRALDVYSTLARLDEALSKGDDRVEMVVATVPATVRKADLEGIDVSEVAGFYETPHSRMRKDRDRTHNVRLGASILDGQVILPGRTLSFNDTLGDRSEARGFRYAPVIAGGAIVEGMGGGTCQVASTLYAASFFTGLIIEDRQPHSRPSSYIKLGLDATVSYPDLDLKIRNPFEYPVVIHFTVDDGMARAEIRATERPFTVTLLRKIIGTQPFPVSVIEDSKLKRGEEIITQLGVPGYTVQRYKVIERDKVGYRFQSVDKYPPTTQFVHKGISNPSEIKDVKDAPKPDTHKPYRASRSLRMVQGPGLWNESTHD